MPPCRYAPRRNDKLCAERFHLLLCDAMDYLWTPWRYAFVSDAHKTSGCVFCDLPKLGDDTKAGIVYRGEHCFVILNIYPYTSGHVMVVPYAHLDELQKLPTPAASEMIELSKKMENTLRRLYKPDGVNLVMNIGKAAGAGIAIFIPKLTPSGLYNLRSVFSIFLESS